MQRLAAQEPIRARDASGQTETGETRNVRHDVALQVFGDHHGDQGLRETAETVVVWLITQRSRVQIPPPLPRSEALYRTEKGPSACGLCTDLCTGACSSSAFARLVGDFYRSERAADDQLRQRVRHLAVGLQVGLDVLLHRERYVSVTDPLAERLPVDLLIAASGGVAVPHVMQVDLGQASPRGQLLEPSGDRVGMGRPAIFPAEQHAVIVAVRSDFAPLLVELFYVHLQGGQREPVERQDVLSVLGLAVRLDYPPVDDSRGLYSECSGVQVEQVTRSTRQFAAPHA